jgi:hypothetical protein
LIGEVSDGPLGDIRFPLLRGLAARFERSAGSAAR